MNKFKKVEEVELATQLAWDKNLKVGIYSIVEIDGKAVKNAIYPYGSAITSKYYAQKTSFIEISLNTCKKFLYNDKTDCFDYDVSFQGKPFYGSIPIQSVFSVIDMENQKILGAWKNTQKDIIENNFKEVKPVKNDHSIGLVYVNPDKDILVNESKAKLKILK